MNVMKPRVAKRRILSGVAALVLYAITNVSAQADSVTVFAASSLKSVLDDVSTDFELSSGADVRVSYASSALLARQILQGAPADVFISANVKWMDVVEHAGLIAAKSLQNIASNNLVLIGGRGNDINTQADERHLKAGDSVFTDMKTARVATGLVGVVPLGIYAKEALDSFGHWTALQPQLVETDNARAALGLVALGAVPYGIVYATDALAEPRIEVLGRFPSKTHSPIVYPAAQILGNNEAASDFLHFLSSNEVQVQLAAHGFMVNGVSADGLLAVTGE